MCYATQYCKSAQIATALSEYVGFTRGDSDNFWNSAARLCPTICIALYTLLAQTHKNYRIYS